MIFSNKKKLVLYVRMIDFIMTNFISLIFVTSKWITN